MGTCPALPFDLFGRERVQALIHRVIGREDHQVFSRPPCGGGYEAIEPEKFERRPNFLSAIVIPFTVSSEIDSKRPKVSTNQAERAGCRHRQTRNLDRPWPGDWVEIGQKRNDFGDCAVALQTGVQHGHASIAGRWRRPAAPLMEAAVGSASTRVARKTSPSKRSVRSMLKRSTRF